MNEAAALLKERIDRWAYDSKAKIWDIPVFGAEPNFETFAQSTLFLRPLSAKESFQGCANFAMEAKYKAEKARSSPYNFLPIGQEKSHIEDIHDLTREGTSYGEFNLFDD